MKEKIKIVCSTLVFLLFFPYLITIFLQGTSIENGFFSESATETINISKSEENKENREQQAANAELAVNPFPARRMLRNVWPGRGFAYHSVEEKDKSRSYGADDQVFYDVI